MGLPLVCRVGWSPPRVRRPACIPSPSATASFLQVISLPRTQTDAHRRQLLANRFSSYHSPCSLGHTPSATTHLAPPLLHPSSQIPHVHSSPLYRPRACARLTAASCYLRRDLVGADLTRNTPWAPDPHMSTPQAMCSLPVVMYSFGPPGIAPVCPKPARLPPPLSVRRTPWVMCPCVSCIPMYPLSGPLTTDMLVSGLDDQLGGEPLQLRVHAARHPTPRHYAFRPHYPQMLEQPVWLCHT